MRAVLALAMLCSGCAGANYGASFKTSDGTAMAKPGIAAGRTNIVRLADVGGPLARAGVYLFGVFVAAGAVKTKTTVTDVDRGTYIERTTTTEVTGVDQQQLQAAQTMLDTATGDRPVGLTGTLEVATRDLGGDTSGFRYEVGASERFPCGPHLACIVYVGLGVAEWTFHDRAMRSRQGTRVVEEPMVASKSWYFGAPVRLTIAPTSFFAVYVHAELNWVTAANLLLGETGSPSPWMAGVELRAGKWIFARAGIAAARMDRDSVSTTLEAGLGF